jgi:hypothetical protein
MPTTPGPAQASPRCDYSDLPVDSCAHCRGNRLFPEVRRVRTGVVGRPITARFPGRCACGEAYPPGTTIRSLDGSWVADCCATEADET